MDNKRQYTKNKTKNLIVTLHELEEKNGMVKPGDLVAVAADSKHPLHDLFDWDNSSAGEKYRLWQARYYISQVRVEFMNREVPGYWGATVEIEDVPVQGYFSTESVATNRKLHKAVLNEAIRELDHWSKKYKDIQELRNIVDTSKLQQLKGVSN